MAKRPGGEKRGNSRNRAARKHWLLSPGSGFGGDGLKVPCIHCGAILDYASVQADRKIPGSSYRRSNVQPSCAADNRARSNNPDWVFTG